ncbi:hypothetical protein ES703_56416 [subsurface metagenome]
MILKGDCIEVMKAMKPNSVDAMVTDPPYGLEFMNKDWDKLQKSVIKEGCQWWEGEFKGTGFKKLPQSTGSRNFKCKKCGHYKHSGTPCKCDSPDWQDSTIMKQHEMQLWHTRWLTEAYRVLKPGGSMLVMGGTRTFHRLMCAIEDSGFIIKDTLMWLYGSGFPKAQDLGKMIDKRMGKEREVVGRAKHPTSKDRTSEKSPYQNEDHFVANYNLTAPSTDLAKHWDGFKVGGIKPAYEPIIWAVKPPEGSYVDNVLKHGVGAVNVDECRVGYQDDEPNLRENKGNWKKAKVCNKAIWNSGGIGERTSPQSKGRFPANVILSHHPECVQVGMKRVKGIKGGRANQTTSNKYGEYANKWEKRDPGYADPNGYEQIESWDCHPDCAVRLLDEQSKKGGIHSAGGKRNAGIAIQKNPQSMFHGEKGSPRNGMRFGDSGGASRFFYCAKVSRSERNAGLEGMEEKDSNYRTDYRPKAIDSGDKGQDTPFAGTNRSGGIKNNHPTVKPIKLFEWLIRLVTREGQIVLDPFIGSGTTIIAAHNTGRKCVGIEKEGEYLEIARRRATHWRSRPRQLEMTGG